MSWLSSRSDFKKFKMHIFHKCLALHGGYPNLTLSKHDKVELNINNQKKQTSSMTNRTHNSVSVSTDWVSAVNKFVTPRQKFAWNQLKNKRFQFVTCWPWHASRAIFHTWKKEAAAKRGITWITYVMILHQVYCLSSGEEMTKEGGGRMVEWPWQATPQPDAFREKKVRK